MENNNDRSDVLYTPEQVAQITKQVIWEVFDRLERAHVYSSPRGQYGRNNPIRRDMHYTSAELQQILYSYISSLSHNYDVALAGIRIEQQKNLKIAQGQLL